MIPADLAMIVAREVEAEAGLSGECIMLMRKHLAEAGIEATFADDVAAIASARLQRLEEVVLESWPRGWQRKRRARWAERLPWLAHDRTRTKEE